MTTTLPSSGSDQIDLAAPGFWARPLAERDAAFAVLRRERPVSFQAESDYDGRIPQGPGYWALTKYDDIMFVSRHPDLFCSGNGTAIVDIPTELGELFGSMIAMDAPRHTKLRMLVSRSFTPKMVARVMDYVHEIARECVADIAAKGTCDFVTEVAAQMPLRIICDMMGVPRSDNQFIFEQTNHFLGALDPEYNDSPEDMIAGGWRMWNYAQKLGAARLEDPQDDLTTALMHAEVDGERLTAAEFGSFFVLLCNAGSETTRNAIAHGFLQLSRHPDQRELLFSDPDRYMPDAVEEIIRYASPVMHFRRTATARVELPSGRHTFEPGEKVVLWYNSANRDEDVFDRPDEFDITRSPNDHIAFGAGGPHFCLGTHLARREIRVLFEELYRVLPDITASGEPAMLQSDFINGIKHLDAEFTPAGTLD